MLAGARERLGEVLEIGDRREAIRAAVRRARAGDIVLIAGKGHETGQEVAGTCTPSTTGRLRARSWPADD